MKKQQEIDRSENAKLREKIGELVDTVGKLTKVLEHKKEAAIEENKANSVSSKNVKVIKKDRDGYLKIPSFL